MLLNKKLGFSTKKHDDLFDENNHDIQKQLAEKRSAYQVQLAQASCQRMKVAFPLACNTLQCMLRNMQTEWWTNLAERVQQCTNTGVYKGFFEAVKVVYGPSYHTKSPLRSADGKELLTKNYSILNLWSEHFHTHFNTRQQSNNCPQPTTACENELDKTEILQETRKAIEHLKSGKAAWIATGSKGNPNKIFVP